MHIANLYGMWSLTLALAFSLTLSGGSQLRAAEPADAPSPDGKRARTEPTAAEVELQANPKSASNLVAPPLKVLKYDEAKDSFIYKDSRQGDLTRVRPGGTVSYHGTRLTQYRFMGPPSRAGLYADIVDYQVQAQLDPRKYQYRYGNYGRTGGR